MEVPFVLRRVSIMQQLFDMSGFFFLDSYFDHTSENRQPLAG